MIETETCRSQIVCDVVRAGSAQPGHEDRVHMLEPWHAEGVELPRVNVLPTSILKTATTNGVVADIEKIMMHSGKDMRDIFVADCRFVVYRAVVWRNLAVNVEQLRNEVIDVFLLIWIRREIVRLHDN